MKFGLVLNMDKCQFGVQGVEFLSHSMQLQGRSAHQACVGDSGVPAACGLQTASVVSGPGHFLHAVHARHGRNSQTIVGHPEVGQADFVGVDHGNDINFCHCQGLFAMPPSWTTPTSQLVDASDTHIGAVLQKKMVAG